MTRRNPILKWLDERPAWAVIAVSFVALLVLWHAIVVIGDYPTFILPGPLDVAEAFVRLLQDGRLVRHSLVTLSEVIPGLILGVAVAVVVLVPGAGGRARGFFPAAGQLHRRTARRAQGVL